MLPLYEDTLGEHVLMCEVCDRPVCVSCQPDALGKCAGEPMLLHCVWCSEVCEACAADLRAAMNLDAERGK